MVKNQRISAANPKLSSTSGIVFRGSTQKIKSVYENPSIGRTEIQNKMQVPSPFVFGQFSQKLEGYLDSLHGALETSRDCGNAYKTDRNGRSWGVTKLFPSGGRSNQVFSVEMAINQMSKGVSSQRRRRNERRQAYRPTFSIGSGIRWHPRTNDRTSSPTHANGRIRPGAGRPGEGGGEGRAAPVPQTDNERREEGEEETRETPGFVSLSCVFPGRLGRPPQDALPKRDVAVPPV